VQQTARLAGYYWIITPQPGIIMSFKYEEWAKQLPEEVRKVLETEDLVKHEILCELTEPDLAELKLPLGHRVVLRAAK
jgi:hypothetical protein